MALYNLQQFAKKSTVVGNMEGSNMINQLIFEVPTISQIDRWMIHKIKAKEFFTNLWGHNIDAQ